MLKGKRFALLIHIENDPLHCSAGYRAGFDFFTAYELYLLKSTKAPPYGLRQAVIRRAMLNAETGLIDSFLSLGSIKPAKAHHYSAFAVLSGIIV